MQRSSSLDHQSRRGPDQPPQDAEAHHVRAARVRVALRASAEPGVSMRAAEQHEGAGDANTPIGYLHKRGVRSRNGVRVLHCAGDAAAGLRPPHLLFQDDYSAIGYHGGFAGGAAAIAVRAILVRDRLLQPSAIGADWPEGGLIGGYRIQCKGRWASPSAKAHPSPRNRHPAHRAMPRVLQLDAARSGSWPRSRPDCALGCWRLWSRTWRSVRSRRRPPTASNSTRGASALVRPRH